MNNEAFLQMICEKHIFELHTLLFFEGRNTHTKKNSKKNELSEGLCILYRMHWYIEPTFQFIG